jgi:hypothetical protein
LSADVRIARNGKDLDLQVDVRDDMFDWSSTEMAERDRIELALRSSAAEGYWLIHISGDPTKQAGKDSRQVKIEAFRNAAKVHPDAVSVTGKGGGHRRTYQMKLHGAAFPLSEDVEMNLAIWDADGKGVSGWLEAVPGMKQLREGNSAPEVWLKLVPN